MCDPDLVELKPKTLKFPRRREVVAGSTACERTPSQRAAVPILMVTELDLDARRTLGERLLRRRSNRGSSALGRQRLLLTSHTIGSWTEIRIDTNASDILCPHLVHS